MQIATGTSGEMILTEKNINRKQGTYVPDLVKDLAQCDVNYYRLLKVFPEIDELEKKQFGLKTVDDERVVVEIEVLERCPFTTVLELNVQIYPEHKIIKWPKLQMRVYRDTKSAEVISFDKYRRFNQAYDFCNERLFQPDEKSQVNRYLGELLEHFMVRGYSLNSLELS